MTTTVDTLLSVVAPLEGDCGAIIDDFVRETVGVLCELVTHYEIVLVDDGTTDDTAARCRDLLGRYDFVRYVRLSRHFGEETAIAAGLDAAIGDFVVVMLPHTDPPELIARFLERARGDADIVYGVREHRQGEPWWYRAGARTFYWYINSVLRAGLPEDSTQFRCMSRQVVNAITSIRDPDRYLRLLTSYVGFTKEGLRYSPLHRSGRAPVRPKGEAVSLAAALVIDHTTQPLRLVSGAAVTLGVLYVLFAVVLLVRQARETSIHLPFAIAFLSLAVVLAVLGEYVGHLMRRVRARPSYYVRDEAMSAVMLREERENVVGDTIAGDVARRHIAP